MTSIKKSRANKLAANIRVRGTTKKYTQNPAPAVMRNSIFRIV
jgi:hypothetical protein